MSFANLFVRSLFVFLLFASPAPAAIISISSAGNPASFSVEGAGMDGVTGIQLDIAYDAASLNTPTVTQGGLVTGAILVANTSIPGLIKIAVISTKPFNGSGAIAKITFAKGSGSIRIASQHLIDSAGSPIGAGTINGPDFISTVATASSNPTYLGNVSMPVDTLPSQPTSQTTQTTPVEQVPALVASAPPPGASPPETSKNNAPVEEKTGGFKQVTHPGILERFRSYTGEKNPVTLSALFTKEVAAPTMRQTPAIAVSNGISTLSVTVELPVSDVSPNFLLYGAKLASIEKDIETGKWIIELLPHTAVFQSTLTIMIRNSGIDFPLTVIPQISSMKFTDKDFYEFIKDDGAAKPKFDLNGDGRHDYVDNYIYTGHYLLHRQARENPRQIGTK